MYNPNKKRLYYVPPQCCVCTYKEFTDRKTSGCYDPAVFTNFLNDVSGLECDFVSCKVAPRFASYFYNLKNPQQFDKIDKALKQLSIIKAIPIIRLKDTKGSTFAFMVDLPHEMLEPLGFEWCLNLSHPSPLSACVGVSDNYEPVFIDLLDAPHILVAGTSGAGKSVTLNTLLCSLLLSVSPYNLEFLFIDPKYVELSPYAHIMHNCLGRIVNTVEDAEQVLKSVIKWMDRKYQKMQEEGVVSINDLPFEKQKHLAVVIDEFADLTLADPILEDYVSRIAQKGRACGIHLIICTQRPTVQVVSGLIKANMTTRIALKTASVRDSINILDHKGAEQLLGQGDALVKMANSPAEVRCQIAHITQRQIKSITDFITKETEDPNFPPPKQWEEWVKK